MPLKSDELKMQIIESAITGEDTFTIGEVTPSSRVLSKFSWLLLASFSSKENPPSKSFAECIEM